ncbi:MULTISPECIES: hypothetical protein [unclassified Pseudomonas]|uniref:hypothetical protein n=1 Tax=unclassified Pseudomonas TaxID=196821 RepID=UPI00244C7934|nr:MULTISPECIES: hypothetical protein [unclassified Pseudomonas]MDG9927454.1 hypothetical protein [Pseudomonas sp. GD04042]MDH0482523.1 hypothetical protein [Pseudomonas sp. GD04015]MDH0602875.1 hypothetical protein [Pseudomonas sp. GD03869]
MIQSPRFHSHAEQQAALGCAAALDPVKFPRRYAHAQAKARAKNRNGHGNAAADRFRAEREQALPRLREIAPTMGITEAARELKMDRKRLARLAEDNGIQFYGGIQRTIKDIVDDFLEGGDG